MHSIGYEQIIAVLGMCVWFIFPIGMFISLVKQDQEAMPAPTLNPKTQENEKLKFFDHKPMIYNNEDDELEFSNEIEDEDSLDNIDQNHEFDHPHEGVGSSHPHHIQ